MKPGQKTFIITFFLSILLIPIHEYGHYIMAKNDGATITDTNFIGKYNQDGLTNPHILVDEFSFSSIPSLIAFYLAGFFVTFSLGAISTIILIYFRSRYWLCAFSWVIISPLASLNDIDRAIELMGPISLAKWIYVGLGALSLYHLSQLRHKIVIPRPSKKGNKPWNKGKSTTYDPMIDEFILSKHKLVIVNTLDLSNVALSQGLKRSIRNKKLHKVMKAYSRKGKVHLELITK